jgi:hypothetical protein
MLKRISISCENTEKNRHNMTAEIPMHSTTIRKQSRSITPIYLTYSSETIFAERYFVVQLHAQLVRHGLGKGVLWFDHDQGIHSDKVTRQETNDHVQCMPIMSFT